MSITPRITFLPVYCFVNPRARAAALLLIASPAWVTERCRSFRGCKTSATSMPMTLSKSAIFSILSAGNIIAARLSLNLVCITAPIASMALNPPLLTLTKAEIISTPFTISASALLRSTRFFINCSSLNRIKESPAACCKSATVLLSLSLGSLISPLRSLRNI